MKWYLKVLRQYADFGGRARRKEFWYFVLFNFIAALVVAFIDRAAGWEPTVNSGSVLPSYGPCYLTYMVAALLPALAVAVRRLHDLGKSGWWLLVGLIPLVGAICLIVLYCQEGESGQNCYGANPKSVKQYFPERRRGKSIAIAFIVGAAVSAAAFLAQWVPIWIQDNVFPGIIALAVVLMLLFGIFYYPSGDSRKTANRRNIAFVLLGIAKLIHLIQGIPTLIENGSFYNIVWQLANLALLALVVLLLLKSERKIIAPAAVSTIVLTIAAGVVIPLVYTFMFHRPGDPFGIIWCIAVILLAVHCLQGKAAEEEEEGESLILPEEAIETLPVDADYALLHIYRSSLAGALISYDLHLDNEVICRVSNNSKATIKIDKAGSITLWAKTESKTELPIDIQMGREYFINCGVQMGILVGRPKLELVNNQKGRTGFSAIKGKI